MDLVDLWNGREPKGRSKLLIKEEDEDASIDVYLPTPLSEDEVLHLERALGERCNEILVKTGLFIIGAVQD